MYRIRFHGRGGQGIKTAARILGSAFFAEGFEVQDAPRYGAERRGAAIFATVRAARTPIHERGPIARPDLVVVADESLVTVPAAGVLPGLHAGSVLLLHSVESAATWRERLRLPCAVLTLPSGATPCAPLHLLGATCAAAAARIVGVVSLSALEGALGHELAGLDAAARDESLAHARSAWEAMAAHAGSVLQTPEPAIDTLAPPEWVDVPFEPARVSAPDVHGAATSVQVKTGLWRTMRPVIDLARCHRCTWVCGSLCPDGAIHVDGVGAPQIDYDHCKGCLVCVAVCPPHAIDTLPEREAVHRETGMVTA